MKILHELEKGRDRIFIHEDGGMVTGEFELDGELINPFYSHPWPEHAVQGLVGFLKGDFFCVPFGSRPQEPVPGYESAEENEEEEYAHGFSSNGKWSVVSLGQDSARISIEYQGPVVDRVEREIGFLTDRKGITFHNCVMVRQDAVLPVGAHPIFRLPERPGRAKLVLPKARMICTYPIKTDATSILKTGAVYTDVAESPLADGGHIDLSRLPLEHNTEEVIMLADVAQGRICLENHEEGYRAVLEFDHTKVPNFLLWISNRGRQFAPWDGRNLCLGIEPVVSAFDFGTAISCGENALSRQGVKTCVSMSAGTPFTFDYQIYVEKI